MKLGWAYYKGLNRRKHIDIECGMYRTGRIHLQYYSYIIIRGRTPKDDTIYMYNYLSDRDKDVKTLKKILKSCKVKGVHGVREIQIWI